MTTVQITPAKLKGTVTKALTTGIKNLNVLPLSQQSKVPLPLEKR